MVKRRGLHFLLFTAIFMAVICSTGCKNYMCVNNQILTAFTNFNSTDIDSFVLRRYQANDSFHHLIDTLWVVNPATSIGTGNAVYTIANDSTTVVYINNVNGDQGIFPGYDWQIYLPAVYKTVRLYNILAPQIEGVSPCSNPVLSYTQDSVNVSSPFYPYTVQQYTNGYWAIIKP